MITRKKLKLEVNMRALILAIAVTVTLAGCKLPWDREDSNKLCNTASCAAEQ